MLGAERMRFCGTPSHAPPFPPYLPLYRGFGAWREQAKIGFEMGWPSWPLVGGRRARALSLG
jgi:hypothetical protein